MTNTFTLDQVMTAHGYEARLDDTYPTYAKSIEGFMVFIQHQPEAAHQWAVSVWESERDEEIANEWFPFLLEALDFAPKFIDRLAAESGI